MNIAIIGCGYVGVVTGIVLAQDGFNVCCVDNDENIIEQLNNKKVPFYEPELEVALDKAIDSGKLHFSRDFDNEVIKNDIIYIAVGTPSSADGGTDLKDYKNVINRIGQVAESSKLIVNKSTVPLGTADMAYDTLTSILKQRNICCNIDIVSNPEFLSEGKALQDALFPSRIVVGCSNDRSRELMEMILGEKSRHNTPIIFTDIHTAELIKYAANSYLAMKLTYMNEIAGLCDVIDANIQDIELAMGSDVRIGGQFLKVGPGYGGSCLPKDTLSLAYSSKKLGYKLNLVESTIIANKQHFRTLCDNVFSVAEKINTPIISILGISFKANTSDIRDSLSIKIMTKLLAAGYEIKAYDPAVKNVGSFEKNERFTIVNSVEAAISNTNIIIVMTEWDEFRNIKFEDATSKNCMLFDYRNMYSRESIERMGIRYRGIGNNR